MYLFLQNSKPVFPLCFRKVWILTWNFAGMGLSSTSTHKCHYKHWFRNCAFQHLTKKCNLSRGAGNSTSYISYVNFLYSHNEQVSSVLGFGSFQTTNQGPNATPTEVSIRTANQAGMGHATDAFLVLPLNVLHSPA